MASTLSSDAASSRSARLSKLYALVLRGKREIQSVADAKLFLEAVCDQSDRSACIEKLIASPQAFGALAKSLRFDVSLDFLIGYSATFLLYLTDPALKQLCSGQFLLRILECIAEPPTFWNALFKAHKEKKLTTDRALQSFAWLLLELLSAQSDGLPDVREIAQHVTDDRSLIDSSSLEVRTLGQKIKHVLLTTSTTAAQEYVAAGPGGRHDNDFQDFRQIAIYPTPDEFSSNERPYYRRADAIDQIDHEKRGSVHLDNQFRLLREDLLGELRNDLQIARGQKKGRTRSLTIRNLSLQGVDCGSEEKRKTCCLTLLCRDDIPQLAKKTNAGARKKFVTESRNFLKHQSFGCLVSGTELVAFATVNRDEGLLASMPPVLVLQIAGENAFKRVLLATKSTYELQFVQVDTPVFAYEPILRCLQTKKDLPLVEELLYLEPERDRLESILKPKLIIGRIRTHGYQNLHTLLRTPKSINLDDSQTESLLQGLTRAVSLIQGPPG